MNHLIETRKFSPAGTWFADSGAPDGAGPGGLTVVLIHGVGLDLEMWDDLAARLSAGYRVVRFDMLGHGRTPALERRPRLADFSAQLLEVLDYLQLSKVVLVGFSMGGLVTQRFCTEHPERLEAIALMSTVYRRTEEELAGVRQRLALTEAEGPVGIVDHAVARWFPETFQAEQPEAVAWLRRKLAANDPRGYTGAYRVFVQGDAEVGAALTGIDCPALVMTGDADVGSTPVQAERMAEDCRVKGSAELVILPGSRHMTTMDAPDAVAAHLSGFLSGLTGQYRDG